MLKDITLGQFFPGKSMVHRLDARTKILVLILYITALFMAKNFAALLLVFLSMSFAILNSGIRLRFFFRGLKPMVFIIVFTAVLNIFYTPGNVIWEWGFLRVTTEGIRFAIFMVLRLIFLIVGTSLLTYTTSPIRLTDGLESLCSPLRKIRVPVHELAMMMTLALRFIPTLIEETDKIMSAQKARGADFENGKLLDRAKALIPVLVPLFVGAFSRAAELATAMECRCYNGGEGRTRLRQDKMEGRDFGALALSAGIFVLSILLSRLPIL